MTPQERREFDQMKQDIQEMQGKFAELFDWKKQREEQQISYPLDANSIRVIGRNFLQIVTQLNSLSVTGREFPLVIIAKQNDQLYYLTPSGTFYPYTANASTDLLTMTAVPFIFGDTVQVYSDGTVPGGLSSAFTYYVVGITGNSFKLAEAFGNFTFTGSVSGGATSATLSVVWAAATGTYYILFSNGDFRQVTLTNGSAAVSWTGGLSSGATSSIAVKKAVDLTDSGVGNQYITLV